MPQNPKLPALLKTVLWILAAQLVLVNLSAALYAYRFTHFAGGVAPLHPPSGVLARTWRVLTGPRIYRLPASGEPSFPVQKISLVTTDSLHLAAFYARGNGARGCVIFLHGFSANKSYLLKEAAQFAGMGYSVLLPDLRGHGESEGDRHSFGVAETADLQAAWDFARARGEQRILIYGSSMGAVLALKATAAKAVTPAALICDMPFASLHDHLKARARTVGFPQEPFAALVTGWIGLENGYNGFRHETTRYAGNVHCPVLLQWGALDGLVQEKEVEQVFRSLATSEKKLVVYPMAGHESFLQHDALTWKAGVQELIQKLP